MPPGMKVTFGVKRVLCSMSTEDYEKLEKLATENYRSLSFQAGHMLHELLAGQGNELDWVATHNDFITRAKAFEQMYGPGLAEKFWMPLLRRFDAGDRSEDLHKQMEEMR